MNQKSRQEPADPSGEPLCCCEKCVFVQKPKSLQAQYIFGWAGMMTRRLRRRWCRQLLHSVKIYVEGMNLMESCREFTHLRKSCCCGTKRVKEDRRRGRLSVALCTIMMVKAGVPLHFKLPLNQKSCQSKILRVTGPPLIFRAVFREVSFLKDTFSNEHPKLTSSSNHQGSQQQQQQHICFWLVPVVITRVKLTNQS